MVALGLALAGLVGLPAARRGDRTQGQRRIARVLLLGAVLAVLVVTMSRGGASGSNWIPGAGISSALHNVDRELGLINLLGNIVMFVPIGLLLPFATGARFARSVGGCAGVSGLVELLQLFTARSLDIDDVVLNTLGGALGAALGVAVSALLARRLMTSNAERPAAQSVAQ